jgi:hypothetical protein
MNTENEAIDLIIDKGDFTEAAVEAAATRYLSESRELEITFNTGAIYRWPVDALQMLERTADGWQDIPRPTDEQLANVRLWPHKEVVEFTSIEQCFEVAALIRGQLGSKSWMSTLLNAAKPS